MEQKKNKNQMHLKNDIWNRIEKHSGEEIPPCIIKILEEVGYSTSMSISSIQPADIEFIEECVNKDLRHIVNHFTCCNSETYQNQKEFHLLPGHRKLILSLKNYLQRTKPTSQLNCHSSVFSFLLKTLIETAEINAGTLFAHIIDTLKPFDGLPFTFTCHAVKCVMRLYVKICLYRNHLQFVSF